MGALDLDENQEIRSHYTGSDESPSPQRLRGLSGKRQSENSPRRGKKNSGSKHLNSKMKSLKGNRSKNLNSDDSLTDEGIQEMSNEDDSSHRASRFRGDRDSMPSHRRL